MSLRFAGDFALWQALALALLAGVLAWWVYRREVGSGLRSFVLPALRALAVFIVVLMLAGPVVETVREVGRFGRVLVFVDTSQSMRMTDEQMDAGRKLLAAHAAGIVPDDAVDLTLRDVTEDLAAARRLAMDAARNTDPEADPVELTDQVVEKIVAAFNRFRDVDPVSVVTHVENRGAVTAEYYENIEGQEISDLLERSSYPGNPSTTRELAKLDLPRDHGDNYGVRIRGYLHPPKSGRYTFWIASDDQSAFSLSKDNRPGDAEVVCGHPGSAGYQQWDDSDKQKSNPIYLDESRKYYFEILFKEGPGKDHCSVRWQLPDGDAEIVQGDAISAYRAADPIEARQNFGQIVERFQNELLKPAQQMADRVTNNPKEASLPRDELNEIASAVSQWRSRLEQTLTDYAGSVVANADPELRRRLSRFDAMSRRQRVGALLAGPNDGLLSRLAADNRVELLAMNSDQAQMVWNDNQKQTPPSRLPDPNEDRATDLSSPLRQRVGLSGVTGATRIKPGERAVAVVFTDGRHNQGLSPVTTAKALGSRGIPVHTVGFGALRPPHDISVIRVDGPDSVFIEDRIKGKVRISDDMPPDKPFTIKITHRESVLWEKKLRTNTSHHREIEFDFGIKEAAQAAAAEYDEDVTVQGVPLAMKVKIEPIEGEREPANNQRDLLVRAVLAGRKMLIVDGRPRWETRYLRNMFRRDEKWEVNALIDTSIGRKTWPRGQAAGTFPKDRQSLYAYDGVILGDVPPNLLKPEEIEWLRDFVDKNGSGMIFLAGRRGNLREYVDTPLEVLLPVKWTNAAPMRPDSLTLTETGQMVEHLRLVSDSQANLETWQELQPPKWLDPITPAVDTDEVLAEAVQGDKRQPMIVRRRIGAGRAWYIAADESWRWRYDVGNEYMDRFWNQVINRVMEPPYAVKDKYVSLDVDKIMIAPGEMAQVRARLRDENGRAMVDADAQVHLYDEAGQIVASAPLETDGDGGGRYFAEVQGPEQGGVYNVGVSVDGLSDSQVKARTRIAVRPSVEKAGEMAELTADEPLLQKMAAESTGQYLREEAVRELPSLLSNLSKTEMRTSNYSLWDNWTWFAPVVLLLTAEWILRRKWGLV